jgi:hypothetical protein
MRAPLLALLLTGCPKTGAPEAALTGLAPSAPHHGAWFGSGMAFPEGELCLVFCPDARLFAGDASCDDVRSPEFAKAWTYTLASSAAHAERDGQAIDFKWLQSGAHAVADIANRTNLPLDLQSTTSPLCDNAPMPDVEAPKAKEPEVPF